jgi:ABC-2 type transport system permease protein
MSSLDKQVNQQFGRLPGREYYDSAHRPPPLIEELVSLVRYRELIIQFIARSIKTRYKRSILGVMWTLLNPLLTMIVLTLVFSQIFRFSTANYPVYVLSGLIAWNFFSSTTTTAMSDMLWSGSLLGRIYVPKSAFAVSAVGTGLVNLGLSLIPLLLIALVLGVRLTPALLVLPLSILILTVFTLGVSLFLATAAVYFADMISVYSVLLTILLYATPIIYPIEFIQDNQLLYTIIQLNPLYSMVEIFRQPLLHGATPGLTLWLMALGYALAALVGGGLLFTSRLNDYAYRI